MLVVPGAKPEGEGLKVAPGYGVKPAFHPAVAAPAEGRPARKGAKRRAVEPAKGLEVPVEVEPWWRPALLFPLRGAEGLMMVAMMGLACWVVATLVPELCLGFVADASRFSATFMGYLVSLIVALPGLALGVFAVAYTLQYLGRVLISAGLGEVKTPRPPDRNFDRLTDGLAPWLVWLACGAPLGLGPLAVYLSSRSLEQPANPAIATILAVVGLPYALMALMRTFLHDGGFPNPMALIGVLVRFGFRFLAPCSVVFGLGLAVVLAFTGVFKLREDYFWTFLPLMLGCWMLAVWAAIVGMRVLGVFYHHHAGELRWLREKPWWAVNLGA